MAEPTGKVHSLPEQHPERYEHSDIALRPLMIFAMIVIPMAVAIHAGLYVFFGWMQRTPPEAEKLRPRSAVPMVQQAPQPCLQGIPGFHVNVPRQDMDDLARKYEADLKSSGPGQQPGFHRIPIDQAMHLLIQNGMPAAGPTTQGGENARP